MGCTRARSPKCRATNWKTNPRIMLPIPASQMGRRTRRSTRPSPNRPTGSSLAPRRWQTDEVAVKKAATTASTTAVFMPAPQGPRPRYPCIDGIEGNGAPGSLLRSVRSGAMATLQPTPVRYAPRGMVASIDHLATEAGVGLLRAGGSAVDAAVATSAVLAVTSQYLCGRGGDLWAVVHPGGGQGKGGSSDGHAGGPVALNAAGRAGAGASADRLRAAGLSAIPTTVDPAAVPVPGCVDGWLALHDRFGLRPLAEVLAPAIWYAAQGFPASPGLAAAVPLVLSVDGADDYRVAGGVRPGTVIRRPGVARALEAIASGGREAFYQGEFGEGLLSVGRSVGGSGEYTADDLATVQAEWVDAISAPAWGHRIWTAPPSSQGYLVPASAWIADGLDLPADPDDPLWAHLLIEAARQAAYDRLDVRYDGADGASLLDPARLAPRRAAIDPARAAVLGVPAAAGDTIALCAAAGDRQGITLIQSNAGGWGSMLVVPGVRVFLHNRGQGFSLQPGHPAEYRPGRRPPHTLSPALVTGPADSAGSAGGGGGLR